MGLHLFAHGLRNGPGGVAVLAINTSRTAPSTLMLPAGADRYALAAPELQGASVTLNGHDLRLDGDDALPTLEGRATRPGPIVLAPASIAFFAIPGAGNGSCR